MSFRWEKPTITSCWPSARWFQHFWREWQRILASARSWPSFPYLVLEKCSTMSCALRQKKSGWKLLWWLGAWIALFKGLEEEGALFDEKTTDMLLLIFDNFVHELLANVSIALKLWLCMFAPTATESVCFQNLI